MSECFLCTIVQPYRVAGLSFQGPIPARVSELVKGNGGPQHTTNPFTKRQKRDSHDDNGCLVFSGIYGFPPLMHSDAAPYSPHFNLIGSQDLEMQMEKSDAPDHRRQKLASSDKTALHQPYAPSAPDVKGHAKTREGLLEMLVLELKKQGTSVALVEVGAASDVGVTAEEFDVEKPLAGNIHSTLTIKYQLDPGSVHFADAPLCSANRTKINLNLAFNRATIAERLACSPPTKAIRVQSPAGSLRIITSENLAGRCRWSADFLGDLPFPPPFHSGALTSRSIKAGPTAARCTCLSTHLPSAFTVISRPYGPQVSYINLLVSEPCTLLCTVVNTYRLHPVYSAVVAHSTHPYSRAAPAIPPPHWATVYMKALTRDTFLVISIATVTAGLTCAPANTPPPPCHPPSQHNTTHTHTHPLSVRKPVWNLPRKIGRVKLPNLVRNLAVQCGKCHDGCHIRPYTSRYGGPCTSLYGIWCRVAGGESSAVDRALAYNQGGSVPGWVAPTGRSGSSYFIYLTLFLLDCFHMHSNPFHVAIVFCRYRTTVWGRGGVAVRLLASHLGEPGSILGGAAPRFPHVVIVPDDAAGRRVFSGISRFLRPSIPDLLHTHVASPSSALKTSIHCLGIRVRIFEDPMSTFLTSVGNSRLCLIPLSSFPRGLFPFPPLLGHTIFPPLRAPSRLMARRIDVCKLSGHSLWQSSSQGLIPTANKPCVYAIPQHVLARAFPNFWCRLYICLEDNGGHFQHLLTKNAEKNLKPGGDITYSFLRRRKKKSGSGASRIRTQIQVQVVQRMIFRPARILYWTPLKTGLGARTPRCLPATVVGRRLVCLYKEWGVKLCLSYDDWEAGSSRSLRQIDKPDTRNVRETVNDSCHAEADGEGDGDGWSRLLVRRRSRAARQEDVENRRQALGEHRAPEVERPHLLLQRRRRRRLQLLLPPQRRRGRRWRALVGRRRRWSLVHRCRRVAPALQSVQHRDQLHFDAVLCAGRYGRACCPLPHPAPAAALNGASLSGRRFAPPSCGRNSCGMAADLLIYRAEPAGD
ncbi:hypothetical protein PR048_012350 [Dryococelus australis]|uniref:Uncharacterized protein n=1 Tax=Dryococelus australis TaxID=614101 RepID=A0ABQ9HP43_9NEOP|nr:hypothetical protein PR048_012350 [Dryococelus australis]